jgi:hypothetical protein
MANETSNATGTSAIATSKGKVEQVPDLSVPVNRIYNFVERNRNAYFEDHSLDWCLDEIISRGMAEITRQIKTAVKRANEKASFDLLKGYGMTPAQAADFLKKAIAQQRAEEEAKAAKAKPNGSA